MNDISRDGSPIVAIILTIMTIMTIILILLVGGLLTLKANDLLSYVAVIIVVVSAIVYAFHDKYVMAFLGKNHDQIESIAQIVAVLAGVSTAAFFIIGQRGGRYEREEKIIDIYMDGVKDIERVNE